MSGKNGPLWFLKIRPNLETYQIQHIIHTLKRDFNDVHI